MNSPKIEDSKFAPKPWGIDWTNNRQIVDGNGEPRIQILASTPDDWPQCALLAARVVEALNATPSI